MSSLEIGPPSPTQTAELQSAPERVEIYVEDSILARRIAAALEELIEPPAAAVSCFEDGARWRIDAYYHDETDTDLLTAQLSSLLNLDGISLTRRLVPDENWVAISQAALPPVAAGRFTIHGSHDRNRVGRGPLHIEIDAGEAFGTAHHATTSGCLMAIDRAVRQLPPRSVLDLGCGSGVLAIAAQRLAPAAVVIASDIDPVAVEVARANARANGACTIECLACAGVPGSHRKRRGRYDLVIANILAGPLVSLASPIARSVAPGGRLILSGLLVRQAREVLGAYLARGFILDQRLELAGWATLTLVKRG